VVKPVLDAVFEEMHLLTFQRKKWAKGVKMVCPEKNPTHFADKFYTPRV